MNQPRVPKGRPTGGQWTKTGDPQVDAVNAYRSSMPGHSFERAWNEVRSQQPALFRNETPESEKAKIEAQLNAEAEARVRTPAFQRMLARRRKAAAAWHERNEA